MQATVQITADGMVIANLDSDDYDDDEDTRALLNLRADDMLDQCARVAIAAWFEIRTRAETDNGPQVDGWQLPPRCCGTWALGAACEICGRHKRDIPANVILGAE